VLFPSLRLGYMVLPPTLVNRFLAVRQANDLCPSHLYQAALADFISAGHFTRHIRKTRQLYAERRNALAQALRKEFESEIDGLEMEILGAEAGMHLVITLPPGLSDQKISARAAQEGLWLWPLSAAYAGANIRQGFILGFGGTKADEMLHQVRRLRKAIRNESGYRGRAQSGH
jgi:GntR family transcriptional regulator / MocR family aminotransferase